MNLDLKLICPKCGKLSPLKQFQRPEEILELMKLASRFGKNLPWIVEYLFCFQSAGDKPLKPSRVIILIKEVLAFIDNSGFKYDGQTHSIRPNAIFEAIRQTALKDMLGIKNHNYLKKVAISINQKMIEAEEKEQKGRVEQALKRDPRGPEKIKEIVGKL
jgi:hypothetical protein